MRVEKIGLATLYNGDCKELINSVECDAVITDPPYGIGFKHCGNDRSGIGKGKYATVFAGDAVVGDDAPFDPTPLLTVAPVIYFGELTITQTNSRRNHRGWFGIKELARIVQTILQIAKWRGLILAVWPVCFAIIGTE